LRALVNIELLGIARAALEANAGRQPINEPLTGDDANVFARRQNVEYGRFSSP